ncbi:MAG: hypothetical protein ACTHLE_14795 [Agriterribacter sp.]
MAESSKLFVVSIPFHTFATHTGGFVYCSACLKTELINDKKLHYRFPNVLGLVYFFDACCIAAIKLLLPACPAGRRRTLSTPVAIKGKVQQVFKT